MSIHWNDDLITGIDEVDNQHREMFYAIKRLIDACKKGEGRNEVLNTFAFLEDYIMSHFTLEENIMKKYKYPYYLTHVAEHEQYIDVIKGLKVELNEKGVTAQFIMHTNHKIVQWLISHINREDMALAKHIKTN